MIQAATGYKIYVRPTTLCRLIPDVLDVIISYLDDLSILSLRDTCWEIREKTKLPSKIYNRAVVADYAMRGSISLLMYAKDTGYCGNWHSMISDVAHSRSDHYGVEILYACSHASLKYPAAYTSYPVAVWKFEQGFLRFVEVAELFDKCIYSGNLLTAKEIVIEYPTRLNLDIIFGQRYPQNLSRDIIESFIMSVLDLVCLYGKKSVAARYSRLARQSKYMLVVNAIKQKIESV